MTSWSVKSSVTGTSQKKKPAGGITARRASFERHITAMPRSMGMAAQQLSGGSPSEERSNADEMLVRTPARCQVRRRVRRRRRFWVSVRGPPRQPCQVFVLLRQSPQASQEASLMFSCIRRRGCHRLRGIFAGGLGGKESVADPGMAAAVRLGPSELDVVKAAASWRWSWATARSRRRWGRTGVYQPCRSASERLLDELLTVRVGAQRIDYEIDHPRGALVVLEGLIIFSNCKVLAPLLHEFPPPLEQSDRAYACSVLLPNVWAAQPLHGPGGVRRLHAPYFERRSESVHRRPPARPLSRSIFVSVMSESSRPRADGKTSPLSSDKSLASRSTSMAASDSGTRCLRFAFMRSAGMVHVRPSGRSLSTWRPAPRRTVPPSVRGTENIAVPPAWRATPRSCGASRTRPDTASPESGP